MGPAHGCCAAEIARAEAGNNLLVSMSIVHKAFMWKLHFILNKKLEILSLYLA